LSVGSMDMGKSVDTKFGNEEIPHGPIILSYSNLY